MRIAIGSTNPVKVDALRELIADYPYLRDAAVVAHEVPSGVSDQPRSLSETIEGAMNRARIAFRECTYSFGIESGLMEVPHAKTGYMDVCVCVIFDGTEYHFGLSSAWEIPYRVAELMSAGLTMSEAAHQAGFSSNPNLGSAEGLVGIVTKGRLTRKAYTKEAIRTALIHVDRE